MGNISHFLYKNIPRMDQNHYKTLNKHSINLFKAVIKPFTFILKRFWMIVDDF